MQLVLASSSEYKKELLTRLKVPFISHDPIFNEEDYKSDLTHQNLSELLAQNKAKSLRPNFSESIIIGCDQVIYVDQTRLDKPITNRNAIKQLELMQGKVHTLITSYCLIYKEVIITKSVTATLKMKPLNLKQIISYIQKDQPLNCAGSYKLESLGIALMDEILTEDFTTVTGLPLISLTKDLISLGFDIL